MATGFKAIIFDCDGTLVDSETPGLDVLYEEAVKLGARMTREEAHAEFRGRRMALCVESIGRRLAQRPASFEADFTVHVRQAMAARFSEGLHPMLGALALVSRLQQPFCVATNGPREKAELTLGLTGLLPYFENRIFSAYEVGSWKPSPELFLHAARALGVEPRHCAVVEDSLPGIEAGLAAGMRVYSLCQPETVPPDLAARIEQINSLAVLDQVLHG
ncbi:HAD family hydrolase [Polaromonas jejuensis]|uniref:HAD family hydrolase n=1 Tax=Polaromonas jejuensis TaxID=457502 RepID=A0ABW0Q634_9BURK|nr:HAD-IA family hydrolase [Polaromonas jejuensis]